MCRAQVCVRCGCVWQGRADDRCVLLDVFFFLPCRCVWTCGGQLSFRLWCPRESACVLLSKCDRVGFSPALLLLSVFTWILCGKTQEEEEERRRQKAGPSPLSGFYSSLAPLFYLTERDDRRRGVSVNRVKRWRDGKMDSFWGGEMCGTQMHKMSFWVMAGLRINV